MRKDIIIAAAAVLVVLAVTFGLAQMRPEGEGTPSKPFTGAGDAAGKSGKVVMRVNGEPVTEAEFNLFMESVPEQQRAMLMSPAGRRQVADEFTRIKALEQEAKRRGLDDDEELRTRLELLRSQAVAQHVLTKIIEEKSVQQIAAAYEREKKGSLTLRHIAVAYEGGTIPNRGEGQSRSAGAAMQRAAALVARLRGGEDFAAVARAESDDVQSGQQGGSLGPMRPESLPPEIASVVTKLEPGKVSDPVKTQFAVHVFSVAQPTLEELKPMLSQQVQNEIAQQEIERLQKAAKVDLDPAFFPPAPVPAAAPTTAAPPRPQQ